MKQYFAFVALGAMSVALASPASAVVVGGFTLTQENFGGQYGVHGIGGDQESDTVYGEINQHGSGVTFSTTSGELELNGGGEATIYGLPDIEDLKVVFDVAWNNVTFALQEASTFDLKVNGVALFESGGNCNICSSGNGNTHFKLSGPAIQTLEFTFDPGIGEVRQFRVEGVSAAIPEPATWAMMIGGLGFAGGLLRRRTSKVQFA